MKPRIPSEEIIITLLLVLAAIGLALTLLFAPRRRANMYDQGVVIGRVIGVQAGGPKSELLIVEDRSRPEYPNRVACEFYENQRSKLEGVANGQLVRVVGSIKSREYQGKWYTSFSAFQLTSLAHLDAAPRPDPVADGDELPF